VRCALTYVLSIAVLWAAAIGRRSGFWKARVALARKLAVILHRMWIDGRGFDPKVTAMA